MALSLFAKALVGIFALQAKQAIGEPNKPAAAVAYDAEGFSFTEASGINAYGVEHSFGVGTFVTRDGTTTLEVKHGLCIIFARNGADLIERAEATSNPRATKRHLAKVFRRLAQTRDLDLVVDAASLTAAVLDTVLDALPTPAADDIRARPPRRRDRHLELLRNIAGVPGVPALPAQLRVYHGLVATT